VTLPDPEHRRLVLVTPYYAPHVGGVERYVASLVDELHRTADWSVTVVTSGPRGAGMSCTTTDGTRVYRLPWEFRLSNTPIGLRWRGMLKRIVERERPALVNAHAPVPGMADMMATVVGARPFVATYHTGPMRKDTLVKDLLVRTYQRVVLPRTLRKADVVITSSDYVRAGLPERFRERAVTVHPGIDLHRFTPGPPEPDDAPARALFVGSLAKAAGYKNLTDLLYAMRQLADDGCRIDLTVVGDGDGRPGYERLAASLGLTSRVTFTGVLTDTPLIDAYQRSSFLVLPTLFDSFGTVLAETMACGRPVVSTTTGGVTELVTSGVDGLLVPPGDTTRLSCAIARLARDQELRRRLGTAARQKIVTRLSWTHQAELTIDAYHEAMARHPKCSPVLPRID
jgi:rhamnosyl/mannosyltransferase